ncbi:hypothetical protein [Streptomyces sp. WAC05950]|uniref:hypothetical protein n=1 Tax=Streptomyces sp. WAC05950 TaxID=2487419 RepID=UPI000F73DF28|nr:hypothetical protein [Streptomyces sp. WAC05950]RST13466.1 hypothetical protein EF904_07225 [Streptomyces sp. WAC05950]
MTISPDAVTKGVTDAFDFWLSQHDISTPEVIQAGVERALDGWLVSHSDDLITAIAKAVADKNENP